MAVAHCVRLPAPDGRGRADESALVAHELPPDAGVIDHVTAARPFDLQGQTLTPSRASSGHGLNKATIFIPPFEGRTGASVAITVMGRGQEMPQETQKNPDLVKIGFTVLSR
jgi:hypothetical protein